MKWKNVLMPKQVEIQKMDETPYFTRFVVEPLTFGLRLVRRFTQKRGALLVELLVFVLKLVALLLGFGLFLVGVREFCGDSLLALIYGVEDRFVKEALHQPHQDEKVEHLCNDGEPIDYHRFIFLRLGR